MSNTRIVVVGGGAGGLELATRLGRTLGKKKRAEVVLVDRNATHIWKPLLHEVATGSLDSGIDEVSYQAHAKRHHFQFQRGSLQSLDREARKIELAAIHDDEGHEVVPMRTLEYDYLVLALGSISNDFGTEGVADHCVFLDSRMQAERFRQALLNQFLKYSNKGNGKLGVAIVGAGATGVELSAELFNAVKMLKSYGFGPLSAERMEVNLIEAGDRILPALPERISSAAHQELQSIGVKVRTGTRITRATEQGLETADGELINAELRVWAAGIKAPDFMKNLGGLETNRNNQIMVRRTLQSVDDERIFALGDCCSCPQSDDSLVPPRAQAAHQMASCVAKNLQALLEGKTLQPFFYYDRGSLVSLSRFSAIGNLMGNLTSGSLFVEGRLARLFYISLYRMHQLALHGWLTTGMMTVVDSLNRYIRPRLKLH